MNTLPIALTIRGKFPHVPVDSGHVLYVVEFSNGVIKVGRSQRARARLSTVATVAREMFGDDVHVTNVRITQPRKNKPDTVSGEFGALMVMKQIGAEPIPGRAEFFRGVTFAEATEVVEEALKDGIARQRDFARLRRLRAQGAAF